MKSLGEDGLERIDGRPVELYDGKFVNAFLMEQLEAVGISDGDLLVFTVIARAETPKFVSNKKSGQIKRVNQFRIEEVQTMTPEKAAMLKGLAVEENPVTVSKIVQEVNLGFNPEDGEIN